MKSNYLHEVRKHNKKLYGVICFLIAVQLILTCLNFQITPFYVWSMYGARQTEQNEYPVYVLTYDKDTFNYPTWMDHRKMFFTYTIPHYDLYTQNHFQDPFEGKTRNKLAVLNLPESFYSNIFSTQAEIKNYPKWLKTYMESNLGRSIDTLEVKKCLVHYKADGKVVADNVQLLIKE